MNLMSDKQEKKPLHPETFFLPPLKMVLTFLGKELPLGEKDDPETQEKTTEKDVEKLIEKLSEEEE
jgi:hypothetical protein